MRSHESLKKAVELVGGQKRLAEELTKLRLVKPGRDEPLRFSQGQVWDWLKRGFAPAEVCVAIETLTEAKVTRYDLRPDVFSPDVGASDVPSKKLVAAVGEA